MSNGTKIKTMKDDLLEIENKVSQSIKVPEKQQKAATLSSSSSSTQKPATGFPLPKTTAKGGDLKTKELRNIVDRLAKNRVGNVPTSAESTNANLDKPGLKTTTQEANELKALIDRISKREGEREKPLVKSEDSGNVEFTKTKPAEKPEVFHEKMEMAERSPRQAVQEQAKTSTTPAKPPEKDIPLEKPDLDALIKPVSKPSIKPEEKITAVAPKKGMGAEAPPKKLPLQKQPGTQGNGLALEKKIIETKEVLENIEKKENELKELLEKMTKNKLPDLSTLNSQDMAITQSSARPSRPEAAQSKKTAAPVKTTYLEKLIGSDKKPSLKSLGIKETLLTSPDKKSISAKDAKAKEEKPIMKKIRERLFGMEKEIAAAKLETKKPAPSDQESETETGTMLPKKTETEDYFKKISKEKTPSLPKIESIEEKFSSLQKNQGSSVIKPEKISEFENTSGIIKNDLGADTKKEEEIEKARRDYLDSQYVSPTNRLVFGKQEHYSSIRKHIEERRLDANLKDLASKVATGEKTIISEKEEKKKLKERIISKYHIRSSPFLRNVLIIAVIAIAIGGAALYGYLSNIKVPKPPEIIAPVATGSELKELSQINDLLEISSEKLKNPTTMRDEANKKFISSPGIKFFRLVIKNNNGNIVELKDALEGIGINTKVLPQTFLESSENEYGVIVSKTPKFTTRLSIAIKLKNSETMQSTMNGWEKDRVKMKDALNPLFVSDRSSDVQNSYFQAGNYKNVNIRYISLPDKDTAIDYFIYNKILVVSTTKDDTFGLIDMLTAVK